jgi:integrase
MVRYRGLRLSGPARLEIAGAVGHNTLEVVMATSKASPRKSVQGERYLYSRRNAAGKTIYEVGWRDSERGQHWRTVEGGIQAARAERDRILGDRASGKPVQANPRLTFTQASERYLAALGERVEQGRMRPKTRDDYGRVIRLHLRERFNTRRLNQIDADALDRLMADLRGEDKSEATIAKVLGVLSNVFKYATNRMAWAGTNPVANRERADRPKLSKSKPRRIFKGDELRQTLDAATKPYRTMFLLKADTGARISEVLGLRLEDLWLDEDDPYVVFAGQINEQGGYTTTKTEASSGTVAIARTTAAALRSHLVSEYAGTTYVFETATGTPYDRHNVARSLRQTLKRAKDENGDSVFAVLNEKDVNGNAKRAPAGAVPSLHSFRHTTATVLLNAGLSADDVARRLRHKDATVTRAVYLHEINDAQRRKVDRSLIEAVLPALD